MFCENCKCKLNDNDVICSKCGEKVKNSIETSDNLSVSGTDVNNKNNIETNIKKRILNKKNIMMIAMSIGILMLILSSGFFIFKEKEKKEALLKEQYNQEIIKRIENFEKAFNKSLDYSLKFTDDKLDFESSYVYFQDDSNVELKFDKFIKNINDNFNELGSIVHTFITYTFGFAIDEIPLFGGIVLGLIEKAIPTIDKKLFNDYVQIEFVINSINIYNDKADIELKVTMIHNNSKVFANDVFSKLVNSIAKFFVIKEPFYADDNKQSRVFMITMIKNKITKEWQISNEATNMFFEKIFELNLPKW